MFGLHPVIKFTPYSGSFKKAAGFHLKSADNCHLLSDSPCQEVRFIVETSGSDFSSCPECSEVNLEKMTLYTNIPYVMFDTI